MLSEYCALLWQGRRWILASVLLFVAGLALGLAMASLNPEATTQLTGLMVDRLREVGDQAINSPTAFGRTMVIFRNNATAATLLMAGGLVAGILPATGIFFNSLMIGMLLRMVRQVAPEAASPGYLFLAIAPHGVIELPALCLAVAWGLKFGLAWLTPAASGQRLQVLRSSAIETLQMFALVIILLFIAAVIEANVTFALIRAI